MSLLCRKKRTARFWICCYYSAWENLNMSQFCRRHKGIFLMKKYLWKQLHNHSCSKYKIVLIKKLGSKKYYFTLLLWFCKVVKILVHYHPKKLGSSRHSHPRIFTTIQNHILMIQMCWKWTGFWIFSRNVITAKS